MPRFLNTIGNATLAVAICDRCKAKYPKGDLKWDGDSPGLLVCVDCWDQKDPWKLPARQTEDYAVRNARPDANIDVEE
jgi:hypothetical protein|tara:strand:+ start:6814 stop:7047 length:234 start_codon:yes stop_codon:yes gene_type:complete